MRLCACSANSWWYISVICAISTDFVQLNFAWKCNKKIFLFKIRNQIKNSSEFFRFLVYDFVFHKLSFQNELLEFKMY